MLLRNLDRRLLIAIHLYQRYRSASGFGGRLLCAWAKLCYTFWTVISGSDIHRDASIALNVRFPHLNGVVIHRDAVIGEGCLIMQQVTVGQTAGSGVPAIGAGSYIGAGAKLLGPIRIGRNVRIGANAVVLQDVPDNATAVGVPAIWTMRKG